MNQFAAGPSQPASSETLFPGFPTLDLGRLVAVVWKRLWLAVLIAGGFVGMAVAYVLTAPKIYQSTAVIYVDPKNEGAVFEGLKGVRQASWESLDSLKSMAEGIRNGTVILRVVGRLKLREDATFLTPRDGGYADAELVEIIGRSVSAELRRGTRLIDVSVKDRSPERARAMTAAFIEEFQSLIREQNRLSAEKSRTTLEEEAKAQLARVDATEEKLQEFRKRHAEVALDENRDLTSTKLEDLDKLLSGAANDVLLRRAEYEQYQAIPKEDIERVFEIGDFGTQDHVQKLILARNQKRAEFSRIKEQFAPTHQTYRAYEGDLRGLEEEVRLVAQGIGESVEKGYNRAVEHEKKLRETVQEQKLKLIEVDGIMKEFRTHLRAVDAASDTYERLLERINDTDVTRGVDETVVRTFSEPLVPAKPVSPKKTLTVAAAGVLGSFFGLGVVLLMGLLDRTLHTRKQVESTLGLAVLSEIPVSGDGTRDLGDTLFMTRDPSSLVSEGIRSLRTSLSAYAPRSVMVTSASPNEGKSFCAANLALLQANMGYRTLLVDADFRKPGMASIFIDPMRGKPGEGNLARQGFCEETAYKNLYLITCGRFSSDTGEPMSGEIFARMLHEAYGSFDCVIIDTSPILAVSDGLTYSRHADAVVLVVRAGETSAESARHAMRELQRMRASLVGVVLNGVDGSSLTRTAYVKSTMRSLPAPALRGPAPAGRPG
jgi:capsular exopolysaccharide synthesis family protein